MAKKDKTVFWEIEKGVQVDEKREEAKKRKKAGDESLKGFRVYRIGTKGDLRYKEADLSRIREIIKKHLPTANIDDQGANYTFIHALASKKELKAICSAINKEIEHLPEIEARGIEPTFHPEQLKPAKRG